MINVLRVFTSIPYTKNKLVLGAMTGQNLFASYARGLFFIWRVYYAVLYTKLVDTHQTILNLEGCFWTRTIRSPTPQYLQNTSQHHNTFFTRFFKEL